MDNLEYFERFVNDRYGTSDPPEILQEFLPEFAVRHRLSWVRVKHTDAEILTDGSQVAEEYAQKLRVGEDVMIPVHPLEMGRWSAESLMESGAISVSASYRTVFFEPELNGMFANTLGEDQYIMMKLHLEHPLPGVPGDRRLTQEKIEKCVALSSILQDEIKSDALGDQCEIVPEFLGVACKKSGVLFRRLPRVGLMPLFSMFSRDQNRPENAPYIVGKLRSVYGDDATKAAREFGRELARPLLRSLFAGFRRGFSLEMHAQNVLFRPGEDSLIDKVYFRDLEGVVFSSRFRRRLGLPALFGSLDNAELDTDFPSMTRWYNRNVDHDIGRVFAASLHALSEAGYFQPSDCKIATRALKTTARDCVKEAGLIRLDAPGRYLPLSRSPYGNGLSKGHYYRTRFR